MCDLLEEVLEGCFFREGVDLELQLLGGGHIVSRDF